MIEVLQVFLVLAMIIAVLYFTNYSVEKGNGVMSLGGVAIFLTTIMLINRTDPASSCIPVIVVFLLPFGFAAWSWAFWKSLFPPQENRGEPQNT